MRASLGLPTCIGGRSLFWGGWSPQLTPADLANWPQQIVAFLNAEYQNTAKEIGVSPTTEYISGPLFNTLQNAFNAANGLQIKVTLNGQLINTFQSNRLTAGHIALQAHHGTSRVQFRNLQIKKLP
jgi:hypothetical protein